MEDVKTRKVANAIYTNYLKKAEECFESMKENLEKTRWNAAVIDAVHCGISSADALTVYYKGVRHSGERHEDVVRLLNDLSVENIGKKIQQLLNLIRVKSAAEYEEKLMTQANALTAARDAERFYTWVKEILEKGVI